MDVLLMWYESLPTLNACLNTASTLFLILGFLAIRAGKRRRHQRFMIAAFSTSVLFLISYLLYHAQVGSVRFQGTGILRYFYFTILISHSLLAAVVPFMALVTLHRAFRERFDKHRKIARITLPLWLYVSVTGVVIYAMLYHL